MTLWRRARDAVSAIALIFRAFPELGLTTRAYREPDPRDRRRQLIRIRPKPIEPIHLRSHAEIYVPAVVRLQRP
jgi:hypothetical protein